MMNKFFKYYKAIFIGLFFVVGSLFGGFQLFDRATADFVRISDHANAQRVQDVAIQGIQKQSIDNGTDLLYIHKRGVRGELNQAKEQLRMLEDFDDVDKERRDLLDEIADLETEMERYNDKLKALKPPP